MCFGGIRISPGAFAVRLVSLPTEQYIKCACTSDIRRRRRRRSRKVAVVVHAPRCRRRHPPRHHPRTVAAAESIRPHKRARSHRPPKMASRRAHGGGRGSRLNYWTAAGAAMNITCRRRRWPTKGFFPPHRHRTAARWPRINPPPPWPAVCGIPCQAFSPSRARALSATQNVGTPTFYTRRYLISKEHAHVCILHARVAIRWKIPPTANEWCASGRLPSDEMNDANDNTFLRNSPAVLFRSGYI